MYTLAYRISKPSAAQRWLVRRSCDVMCCSVCCGFAGGIEVNDDRRHFGSGTLPHEHHEQVCKHHDGRRACETAIKELPRMQAGYKSMGVPFRRPMILLRRHWASTIR